MTVVHSLQQFFDSLTSQGLEPPSQIVFKKQEYYKLIESIIFPRRSIEVGNQLEYVYRSHRIVLLNKEGIK